MIAHLTKMQVTNEKPVKYSLNTNEGMVEVNEWIGKKISVVFSGEIKCSVCNRKTKKSFGPGMCFPCFRDAPENSECIIRPELCEGHLGKGRDAEWEEKNHNQPHVVYLALTAGIKVGVTRSGNLETRWIDQGAWKAIPLAEVPYRYLAGKLEVALKEFLSDKTSWQKMLKNEMDFERDLLEDKQLVIEKVPEEFEEYILWDEKITEIQFPVLQYPQKVKSINLDKEPEFIEKLVGIRGQYLIFESGRVINIRKYTGYLVELNIQD